MIFIFKPKDIKAYVTRNFKETISCRNHIIETLYHMLDGRQDNTNAKEFLITDDEGSYDIYKNFKSFNRSSKPIKKEDLK